jgi:hypothetical protein
LVFFYAARLAIEAVAVQTAAIAREVARPLIRDAIRPAMAAHAIARAAIGRVTALLTLADAVCTLTEHAGIVVTTLPI